MTLDGGMPASTSQAPDNEGGTLRLYYSATGDEPYTLLATVPWTLFIDWDTAAEIEPGRYYSTEEGNGVAYLGESDRSNAITIE